HAHRPRHRADGGAVSSSPTSPAAAPDPDGAPLGPAASAATAPRPGTPRRRTHPITPLVTGWKIVVGVLAVLTAQNIAQLLDEFTLQRALIGAGVLVAGQSSRSCSRPSAGGSPPMRSTRTECRCTRA